MKQPSQIENLIMVTPALVDDPVAIAILQDPILMERFSDLASARRCAIKKAQAMMLFSPLLKFSPHLTIAFRMAQLHPALAETANYIAKAVEEEAAKPHTSQHPVNFNDANYPYHMDDFTDEEEMDSSQVRELWNFSYFLTDLSAS